MLGSKMEQEGEELMAAVMPWRRLSPHIQGIQGANISTCPHPGGALCFPLVYRSTIKVQLCGKGPSASDCEHEGKCSDTAPRWTTSHLCPGLVGSSPHWPVVSAAAYLLVQHSSLNLCPHPELCQTSRIWPLRLIWDVLSLPLTAWFTSNRSLGSWST